MRLLITSGVLGFLVVFGAAPEASPPQASFKHRQGGLVHGIHMMDDGATGYTAEDGGRIRYTTDGFASWSFLGGLPEDVRTQILGVHFLDSDHGWAVGEGSLILRYDAEDDPAWTKVDPEDFPEGFEELRADIWDVHFIDEDTGWVAGRENVLWKSTDGGLTWTSQDQNLYDTSSNHITSHILYSSDRYGLDFVQDSSDTWHGYFTGDWGWIFHTTDETDPLGTRWDMLAVEGSSLATGVPDIELYDIEVDGNGDGFATGGAEDLCGRAYRIEDFTTVTWNQLGTSNPDPDPPPSSCTVSTSSSTTLYGVGVLSNGRGIGSGYGSHVWRSPASGILWGNITPLLPSGDPCFATLMTPHFGATAVGTEFWTVGSFGTIRYSADATQTTPTWVDLGSEGGMRLEDGDWVDDDAGWVVGQDYSIFHTDDGGVSFCMQCVFPSDQQESARGVSAYDEDRVCVVGTSGSIGSSPFCFIVYSHSGGSGTSCSGWSVPSSVPSFGPFLPDFNDVHFVTSDGVWAVGTQGWVIHSPDGGVNWCDGDPGNTIPSVTLNGVSFLSSWQGLAVGNSGTAYKQTASGASCTGSSPSWSSIAVLQKNGSGGYATYTGNLLDVAMASSSLAYAVGQDGRVFLYDGTDFREVYRESQGRSLAAVSLAPGSSEVFAGGDGGAVVWYDGSGWEEPKSWTSSPIRGMSFLSNASGYTVGVNYSVMRYE